MNIITDRKHRFERNNVILRSKYQPEAVNLVLDLFAGRKNYLSYPLKDGKRYRTPITVSKKYLENLKKKGIKWKLPQFLTDQMIINAMEGSVDYMYGVNFAQSYKDQEGNWRNDFPINYGLIDLDHKPDRKVDYYSTPELVVDAFAKYGISIHITESSDTGKHCYFFLDYLVYPQNLARVIRHICKIEKLIVEDGLLELFPRVKANGKSLYKAHRLPCQPGSSHNIEEFAKLILHGKSTITNTEFDDLLKASFTKNPSKDKYFKEISKGWTRNGMTQWLTLKIAIWHRIYGEYDTINELHRLCVNFAINAPGYRKYCRHQEDIEQVMQSKVDEVWDNNTKYEGSTNRYIKRKEIAKARLPILKRLIAEGKSLNYIAKELKANKKTIKKLAEAHNITFINSQTAHGTGDDITHTSLLLRNKINSIGELVTSPNVQNEISKLSRAKLKSVLNTKGNVNVSKLAKTLGCHRNTIKLSKAELTIYITNLVKFKPSLTSITKSSTHPNKTDQITADKHKKRVKIKEREATSKIKDRECNSQLQKYPYEDLIKAHKEEYKRKYKSILKTGNIDKLEKLTKKYEVLQLPNGRQHFI